MSALLDVIIPVFLIIGFGYCTVWTQLFSTGTIDGLMKFTQNFAIPVLLFDAIAKVDLTILLKHAKTQRRIQGGEHID